MEASMIPSMGADKIADRGVVSLFTYHGVTA